MELHKYILTQFEENLKFKKDKSSGLVDPTNFRKMIGMFMEFDFYKTGYCICSWICK